ncbi:MAG: glycyl-radical enzyme activating protein [Armatimonadota bacterium]
MKSGGCVFNVQRYSINDGPGIRTTVFLKGCPLHCQWCHNPEGLEPQPQLRYAQSLCTRCGLCAKVCPQGVHEVTPEMHIIDFHRCRGCKRCIDVCPAGSLDIAGQFVSVEDILSTVRRDIPFFSASGGGMTLSGGEPLSQFAFSQALLTQARNEGVHTAVETSALAPWEHLQSLLPIVDLFMIDLKHTDDARHRALTGVSNKLILSNIRNMVAAGHSLLLRIPWVPARNAEPDFLNGLEAFLTGFARPPRIEFMPYHRLGQNKWTGLGITTEMADDIPDASSEDIAPWVSRLLKTGISVRK